MARDDDLIAIGDRERRAGVEAYSERRHVRAQQRNGLGELVAGATPSKLLVRDVALVAIGKAEIVLAGLGYSVELVLRDVLRQPIAAVFGEVQLFQDWMPVHPDNVTN